MKPQPRQSNLPFEYTRVQSALNVASQTQRNYSRRLALEKEISAQEEILTDLQNKFEREQKDVDRLKSFSPIQMWERAKGTLEDSIEEEELQALDALIALDVQQKLVDRLKVSIADPSTQDLETAALDAGTVLRQALRVWETTLQKSANYSGSELYDLDIALANTDSLIKEIEEALNAARDALRYLRSAKQELDQASTMSLYDLAGGGAFASILKNQNVQSAAELVGESRHYMALLNAELADINTLALPSVLVPNNFDLAGDILFDNIIFDFLSHERISSSLSSVTSATSSVSEVEHALNQLLTSSKQQKQSIETKRMAQLTKIPPQSAAPATTFRDEVAKPNDRNL